MKYTFLLLLFLTSCATNGTMDEKITMPQVDKKSSQADEIREAAKTKFRIAEKGGQIFDFYYGPKGSYFIVITPSSGRVMNLSDYDVTLAINNDAAQSPEVISLALADQQVLSGFGESREGITHFELTLNPVDSSLGQPVKFNFKVNINLLL